MAQTDQKEILEDSEMETDHQSAREQETIAGAFEAGSKAGAEADTEQKAQAEAGQKPDLYLINI